jgi:hypothetical protein
MIRDSRRRGWCTRLAICRPETTMGAPKVVPGANHIPPPFDRHRAASGSPRPASEDGQPAAERPVPSLNERGVQDLTAGCTPQQGQEHPPAAVGQAMDGACHCTPRVLLHSLRHDQVGPADQAGASARAHLSGPKGASHGVDIGCQPIGHNQQRSKAGTGGTQGDHPLKQDSVAGRAHGAPASQARRDHQCHRHPQHAGLHVLQVTGLDDLLLMHGFAMDTGRLHPRADRLGLAAEGGLNRRDRATVTDQCHHARDRLLSSAAPKEDCTCPLAERLATYGTAIARRTPAMGMDVPFAYLPPCGAVHVRAEYRLRIDDSFLSGTQHPELSSDLQMFSRAGSPITV